jgi:hypothetical protein
MKILTAIGLMLAIFAGSASADAHKPAKKHWKHHSHHSHHYGKRVSPQVRGYIARRGGHAYGYELDPFLRQNGPYGFYPSFDDRTFWERVQSDPFDSRPGVSAY